MLARVAADAYSVPARMAAAAMAADAYSVHARMATAVHARMLALVHARSLRTSAKLHGFRAVLPFRVYEVIHSTQAIHAHHLPLKEAPLVAS